jgi:hypothetical protein
MRVLLPVLLATGLLAPAAGAGTAPLTRPAGAPAWSAECSEGQSGRACIVWTEAAFPNSLGGVDAITVGIRVDATCTSLHVTLGRQLDIGQPASLTIDDDAPKAFYASEELARLARDVDDGRVPDAPQPEFADFARQAAAGRFGDPAATGRELVARFAFIKDEDRLAVGCPGTARLLPALRAGHSLTLAFFTEPARRGELYHWPQLTRRALSLPLAGLADALDRLPARSVPAGSAAATPSAGGARQGASGNPTATILP